MRPFDHNHCEQVIHHPHRLRGMCLVEIEDRFLRVGQRDPCRPVPDAEAHTEAHAHASASALAPASARLDRGSPSRG